MKKSPAFFTITLLVVVLITAYKNPSTQKEIDFSNKKDSIRTGADQTEKYLPYLKGKRVAILANQTSIIGNRHMVDSLQSRGVNIVKVFGPEHGFRGNASAGAHVADEKDQKTGIPIISLYGRKNKPTREDLADVDIVIYDVQDVGVRFYTNINALSRLMEACAESKKELMILDRICDPCTITFRMRISYSEYRSVFVHILHQEPVTVLRTKEWISLPK